jgi:tetratricopeptide (TPR) repeat protein
VNSSFVERHISESDGQCFLSVSLTASAFGRQKLSVSPYKLDIEQDTEILQFFGATQQTDLRHGLNPRLLNLIRKVQQIVQSDKFSLTQFAPMLEYIARRVNSAWLMMSDMYSELGQDYEMSKECIRKYIEREKVSSNQRIAWEKMAKLCRSTDDYIGEIHALLEIIAFSDVEYETVSDAANRINNMLSFRKLEVDSEKKEVLIRNIADIMKRRIDEATADDCSRLAWLLLHLRREAQAHEVCRKGLELDPYNMHCHKLMKRLEAQ